MVGPILFSVSSFPRTIHSFYNFGGRRCRHGGDPAARGSALVATAAAAAAAKILKKMSDGLVFKDKITFCVLVIFKNVLSFSVFERLRALGA